MIIKIDKEDYNYDLKELAKSFGIEVQIQCIYLYPIVDSLDNPYIVLQSNAKNEILGKYYINNVLEKKIAEPTDIFLKEKNVYKRLLYSLLSDITKKNLPWGILTGIRPVKIVHKMLKDKYLEQRIIDCLLKEYYIQENKAKLILSIAIRQKNVLKKINDGIGVYISIPFCPSRCSYCSFYSCDINKESKLVDLYLKALERELKEVFKSKSLKSKKINSIYIGGGTPSSISEEQLNFLMNIIKENIDQNNILEYTFEGGRPETINIEKLNILNKFNVTRLSINPQTMNDKTLKKIGRNHTSKEIIDSFNMARNQGFNNINMDIILGLEDETLDDLKYTLKEIESLNPESLTVHTLSIKKASKLIETIKNDDKKINANDISQFMSLAEESAGNMNMNPYYLYRQKNILLNLENIGFSKNGLESPYNIGIMEEKQTILAFGSGSISKFFYDQEDRIQRIPNIKDVRLYIERIDELIEKKLEEVKKWS